MKAVIFLSVIIAAMFALPAYLILLFVIPDEALKISLIWGVLTFLIMFLCLDIYTKLDERKYSKFESKLKSRVFCKAKGNFLTEKRKVITGSLFFCEDEKIVIAFLDQKPHMTVEIMLNDIETIYFDELNHISITVKDGKSFFITSADADKVRNALTEKGWI